MSSQTITWTVLPNGVAPGVGRVFFSVHVAPRLSTNSEAAGTLNDFADWKDWPVKVSAATFGLEFPGILDQSGKPLRVSARRVSTPVSKHWTALFPPTSRVKGHKLPKFVERRLRSYPTRHVRDFINQRYGRFGARYPDQFPPLNDLAAADAFGPVGFEFDSDRTGPGLQRKERLRTALEKLFNLDPQNPAGWAVPFRPGDALTSDGIGMSFLQAERFHRRREQPVAGDPPKLDPPELDFHQVVAMTREHNHLQRLLGLVLDFESADPALLALAQGNERDTEVRVVTDLKPVLGNEADVHVRPTMRCRVGKGTKGYLFTAIPDTDSDQRDRMLRVGDTDRFAVVQVDPDNAALAVRQFADTVTRARHEQGGQVVKRSAATPDTQALPALHTAGFSVGRLSRASRLADKIDRNRKNNEAAFSRDGKKITDDIALNADDVVRGYRWDVRDETTGKWYSLMWRDGAYVFVRTGNEEVGVLEETAAQTAPTTSGANGDEDLYIQESLMHWAGWSLAVGRPGKALAGDNGLADNDGPIDEDFQFRTRFSARALPRLRFGRRYELRARVVDIAGNSVTAEQADAMTDAALSTAAETFRRFEPVPAPEVLLRSVPGEAESLEVMVLRGNTGSDTAVGTVDRHVLPPRTTVQVAEQHGMLDRAVDGRPMDAVAYADLAARDAAVLEQHSSARTLPAPADDHWYYDTDTLPVPYLPEPLARRILVRGLPGSTTSTTIVAADPATWPNTKGFRIRLQQGTPGWSWNGTTRVLTVRLMPGDSYQLQISAQFDLGDLDLMALWPLVEKGAADWNAAHPSDRVNVTALRESIVGGRHWMFTPARTLTLTHAVRTPLAVPDIGSVTAKRPAEGQLGSTHAVLGSSMKVSRKSSGSVEFAGRWTMPVDDGVTAPDMGREFRAAPITVTVDRAHGPAPDVETVEFQARHEFGDTKARRVRYEVRAVTRYSEFFRERREVAFSGTQHTLGVPIDPAHLVVVDKETQQQYHPGPLGSIASKASGDYVITNAANGTFERTTGGRLTSPRTLEVSFVRPETRSAAAVIEQNIPSTARPAAPKIRQVVPIFRWESPAPGQSVRRGGGLRVYLERPWFSSGAGEKLAVLIWPDVVNDAPEHMRGVVTAWGADGAMHSTVMPDDVTTSSFPQAAVYGSGSYMTVPEFPTTELKFAAYDVAYDSARDLWFCDIRITKTGDDRLQNYFPFVRLALARYQPNSVAGCALSSVATADFTQLAPDRTVVVTGSGDTRTVQLIGPGPLHTDSGRYNEVRVTVERQLDGVTDPVLRWQPASGSVAATISNPTNNNGIQTWSGTVLLPAGAGALRLVVEEFEVHRDGNGGTAATRLVHTDTIPLA